SVGGECKVTGNVVRNFVVAADDHAAAGVAHRDGKDPTAGGTTWQRGVGHAPAPAAIIGAEHSSIAAACHEIGRIFTHGDQASAACGKRRLALLGVIH